MSRVDVIIPCYKDAHFLHACVASVLTQSGLDLRLLILDDASPDDTAEITAELAIQDRRLEFLRHIINQGHIVTYNEGLEWPRVDYPTDRIWQIRWYQMT